MDVRVYRISTCHWCDKVETFFEKHGVNYKSIVIDLLDGTEQENAIAESYHLSKQRSFPVIYIDGTCVIGFHESRLRHLLKLPSQKEEQERIKSEDGEIKPGLSSMERDYHETIEKMREWLMREAKSHGYTINPDKQVVEEILTGLAINEKRYGYKACPCRLATGKYQLDCDIICPCSYCFLDVEKNDGEKHFQRIDVPEHKNKLFECCLIVPGVTYTKEDLQLLLPGQRYMSHVYDKYKVAAGFEVEGAGKDTFVISPEDQMLDKIVEEIVALETNYQLLSVERQRYILAMDKLDILESTIVSKMRIISMNLPKSLPEALKGWLHGLCNNFGDISGIAEESRHRMNDTLLKRDVIRRIFKDWGESDGGFNYPMLSRFFLERVDTLGDQYQRLFIRIDGIRREMADLITKLVSYLSCKETN